jgi:hypothetical protein
MFWISLDHVEFLDKNTVIEASLATQEPLLKHHFEKAGDVHWDFALFR